MASTLEPLCDHLDRELERQETILQLCKLQGKAARSLDAETLDARTEALSELVGESLRAEQERINLLRVVVRQIGLPFERQTLTDLIQSVPTPWRERLAHFQKALRNAVGETRRVLQKDSTFMRRAIQSMDTSIDDITNDGMSKHRHYDADGREPAQRNRVTFLLDTRG